VAVRNGGAVLVERETAIVAADVSMGVERVHT
jgi:hypothetical protein